MPSCHWLCWASPAFPAASSAHYNPRNSTAPVVGLVPGRSIGQEHGSRFRNELRGRAPRTGGPRLHRHAPPSCRPRLAKSNAREDRETVLVTGAAGFIGANVVEQFLRSGSNVVAVDNMSVAGGPYPGAWKASNVRRLEGMVQAEDLPGELRFVAADIRSRPDMERLFGDAQGISRVCHLAAVSGVASSLTSPEDCIGINVGGTALLMDLAGRAGCRSFVLASSGSVYGDSSFQQDGSTPRAMEEQDFSLQLLSPYAASKLSAELLSNVFHSMHGMQMFTLRVFTTYGPRGRPDMVVQRFIERLLAGQPIQQYGSGMAFRDYVYVDDVARAFVMAAFKDSKEVAGPDTFNIAGGGFVRLRDLISHVEVATGKSAQVEVIDARTADVSGTYADVSRAADFLGWRPQVTLAEGLRRTVEWTITQAQGEHMTLVQ